LGAALPTIFVLTSGFHKAEGCKMGFFEAISSCFKNFATFSGRARRAEYWWWTLFASLVALAPQIVNVGIIRMDGSVNWFSLIALLIILFPGVAVSVRRLHDTGRSGWWLLINLVPLIGYFIFLYWMIKRGDQGSNQFGPDPIA
jgi:uncharacterized membrane protein YhaH (DUF805 family)